MVGPFPGDPSVIDGGVAAVTCYLTEALAARRDITLVGVRFGSGTSGAVDERIGCPVFTLAKQPLGLISGYVTMRREFRRLIERIRPDIVHGQGVDLAGSLAVESALPNVVTVHGLIREDARYKTRLPERLRSTWASAIVERPTIRRASNLISISPYVTEYYGAALRGRVFEIPNPVSDRYFSITRCPEPGRILFAGRVIPRKRLLDLLEAVAGMALRPRPSIMIAGSLADASYVAQVRQRALALGLAESVTLAGLLDEDRMLEEFRRASVLVLPACQETAPMVIQQAMAAGVPVVASRICGIPYQLVDGKSGLLFPPGDVAALRNCLEALIGSAERGTHMGSSGREMARARYRAGSVAEQTVHAYGEILGAHARRNPDLPRRALDHTSAIEERDG